MIRGDKILFAPGAEPERMGEAPREGGPVPQPTIRPRPSFAPVEPPKLQPLPTMGGSGGITVNAPKVPETQRRPALVADTTPTRAARAAAPALVADDQRTALMAVAVYGFALLVVLFILSDEE